MKETKSKVPGSGALGADERTEDTVPYTSQEITEIMSANIYGSTDV